MKRKKLCLRHGKRKKPHVIHVCVFKHPVFFSFFLFLSLCLDISHIQFTHLQYILWFHCFLSYSNVRHIFRSHLLIPLFVRFLYSSRFESFVIQVFFSFSLFIYFFFLFCGFLTRKILSFFSLCFSLCVLIFGYRVLRVYVGMDYKWNGIMSKM